MAATETDEASASETSVLERSPTGRRALKPSECMAASLAVLAAAAALVVFFTAKVCDQELASKGTVVKVCRHQRITDPPMVVLGLVILVPLGAFFSEISGFGITL
ncbi:hypothetical protein ACWGLF_43090 [Streptomyces puniciscabiei]